MGEIKSTLEIIMEKTRGMTLTEGDKLKLKQEDVTGKVRGIAQKFLDGILTLEKVEVEMVLAAEDGRDLVLNAVSDVVVPLMMPGEDNIALMRVLEVTGGIDTNQVKKMLAESDRRMEDRKRVLKRELAERLKEKGLSGSAVIPNLNADSQWIRELSDEKKELEESLRSAIR